MRRHFAKILWFAPLVFLWLALATWITWKGRKTDLTRSDCILVLGARCLADGTPGPSFAARCRQGVQLWKQGLAPNLLFSGGRGESGTVEGEVGRAIALSQGVPAAAILVEGQSHTTEENFRYSSEIMRAQGWQSCLVVTDPFHEPRSLALARDQGLEAHPAPTFEGPASLHWSSWAYYTVRETAAWGKYWLHRLSS